MTASSTTSSERSCTSRTALAWACPTCNQVCGSGEERCEICETSRPTGLGAPGPRSRVGPAIGPTGAPKQSGYSMLLPGLKRGVSAGDSGVAATLYRAKQNASAERSGPTTKVVDRVESSSESGSESDCTEVDFETEMDGEELFTKMTMRNAAIHAVDVPKAFEQPQQAPMVTKQQQELLQAVGVCAQWAQSGTCIHGDRCSSQHPGKPGVGFAGRLLCQHWAKTGKCPFGSQCQLAHPIICTAGKSPPPGFGPRDRRCSCRYEASSGSKCTYFHPHSQCALVCGVCVERKPPAATGYGAKGGGDNSNSTRRRRTQRQRPQRCNVQMRRTAACRAPIGSWRGTRSSAAAA